MIIAIDFEFTGLSINDVPISFAAVAENGKELYIELVEHKTYKVSSWVEENVLKYLWSILPFKNLPEYKGLIYRYTDFENAKLIVSSWFSSFNENITILTDVGHYDWVWFTEFFGGALNLPKFIDVVPEDFNYLYSCRYNVDNKYTFEISRKNLAGPDAFELNEHNALDDAKILLLAYRRTLT